MMQTTSAPFREQGLQLTLLSEESGILHLACEGDIVLPDVQPAQDPLARYLGADVYGRPVLLGMEKVNFLDTSGISWLVSAHENFKRAGGILVLHSVPPRVGFVLKLLGMEQVLHTAPELEAARTLVQSRGARP